MHMHHTGVVINPGAYAECRLIDPRDLIGSTEAAAILGITKPSLTRRIAAGTLEPLTQLDGPKGAFIFDRNDIKPQASA